MRPPALLDNLLKDYAGTHFEYDERGNLVRRLINGHGTKFGWNSFNRMVSASNARMQAIYVYDALGRRIAKVSDAVAPWNPNAGSGWAEMERKRLNAESGYGYTLYGWDGDALAYETSRDKRTTTHYVYEPNSSTPLMQATGAMRLDDMEVSPAAFGSVAYYHCDQIGTPQELSDATGELAGSVHYKAWGQAKEVISEAAQRAGVRSPLRFAGQYFDHETGLHYNRHRYYDPQTGRFISKDPIGLAGGLNAHQYAPNSTGWIDPLGLQRTLTGTTKSGLSRCSSSWRDRYGPASMRDHHLIPQAMMNDDNFMAQMKDVGIADTTGYIHRQIAQIPNAQHIDVHEGGWNRDWQNWYQQNPNFTRKDLQQQTKSMMQDYNIPKSSRNFAGRYGSGC